MNKKVLLVIVVVGLFLTRYSLSSKKLVEIIPSPNGQYEIRTYLNNCGATCDFGLSAELCDMDGRCKEIYYQYHEYESFVYWIDDKYIFINQKKIKYF